ncbi:MAG: ABC transporter substrate-binding protein [Gammaproteobacteria bacterium]|nr:ABC transporter substrate-binding protein [Gammaproteobacteria bacterium]MYF38189.1 ABC transporter substrate-binding protein [Gammaproteobacteria bacterium]
MKSLFKLLGVGIFVPLFILSACSRESGSDIDSDTSDTDVDADIVLETTGVSDDEVVFGTHTDLSGPISIYGTESVNGVRMRFDEANEQGGVHGRTIRFIAEDSQYSPQESIRAANKLIHRDKIFAMLLALGTPNNLNVMDEQFKAGIPNLFPLTGSIQMAEPYRKLMFTARGIYYDEIRTAVKYFVEEKGRTAPCVAYIDNDYGQEVYEAVVDQTEEMEIEIVAYAAHERTETEFTATVLRFKEAGCDFVLMGTVVIDTLGILGAAREIGWDSVDWVGSNAAGGNVVAEHPSGAGEGMYTLSHMTRIYPDTEENEDAVRWFEQYEERFNRVPDVGAMEGYRGADLVVKALEIAGRELTREKFIEALESFSDYTDPWGYKLSFSSDNHNGLKVTGLSQVQNGRWIPLDQTISLEK